MEIDKSVVISLTVIAISQIILFCLKIFGVINIGWELVLAPIWIPYVLMLIAGSILAVYIVILNLNETKFFERIFKKHER